MSAKFGLERKAFLASLEKVAKVLPSASAAPILKHFLVEATADNVIRVSATDKSVTLVTKVNSSVVVAIPGLIILPAKEVIEAVQKADGDLIAIISSDDDPSIVSVACGPTKWNLRTGNVENYPLPTTLLENEVHTLNRAKFIEALDVVRKAMAESFKPSLTQIGFRNGKVTAADGMWFQEFDFPEAKALDISIPAVVVDDLLHMLKTSTETDLDVGLSSESHSMVFRVGTEVMTTHAMVLDFPDVAKSFLLPAMSNKQSLKVSRKALEASLRRVRITSDPNTMAVHFRLSLKDFQAMHIFSKNKAGSTSSEFLEVEWTGDNREVIFHHEYLTEMLAAYNDDEIELLFGDDQKHKPSPVLIRSADRAGVLNQLRADLV